MLIEGVFAWATLFLVGPLLVVYLRRRRELSTGHLVAVAIFLTYIVGVIDFALLPIRTVSAYSLRPPVVLQLFFLGHLEVMSVAQYFGNILLGVPFGLLFPFMVRWSLPKVVESGLVLSLLIETSQWLTTKAGIAYPTARAADINDVLLNTFGVLVGVAGFVAFSAVYRRVFRGWMSPPEFWEHFHTTLIDRSSEPRTMS